MSEELRCPSRLHARLTDTGLIEIKCRYDRCGANSETSVLHYFDPVTGDLVQTRKFREPATVFNKKKEKV